MQHAWQSRQQQHVQRRPWPQPPTPCRWCIARRRNTYLTHATAQTKQQVLAGPGTLYQILGVEPSADAAAIKAAYRSRVKTAHPDLYQQREQQELATVRLLELNAAFDVLYDPIQRQSYDAELKLVQEAEAAYAAGYASHLNEVELQRLKDMMERARAALQRALHVRIQAREAERHAKAARKGVKEQKKAQVDKPYQPAGSADGPAKQQATPLPPTAAKEAKQAAKAEQQRQRQERRRARREATQARAQAQYAELEAALLHIQVKQQVRPKSPGLDISNSTELGSRDDDDNSSGGVDQVFDELALYGSASEMLRQVAAGQDFDSMVAQQCQPTSARPRHRSSADTRRQWPGAEP